MEVVVVAITTLGVEEVATTTTILEVVMAVEVTAAEVEAITPILKTRRTTTLMNSRECGRIHTTRMDKRKEVVETPRKRAAVVAVGVATEEVVEEEVTVETDGMVEVADPGKDAEEEVAAATGEVVIRQREEDLVEALEGAAVDGREEVALNLVLEQSPGKRG